jgi:hypothetical protein
MSGEGGIWYKGKAPLNLATEAIGYQLGWIILGYNGSVAKNGFGIFGHCQLAF